MEVAGDGDVEVGGRAVGAREVGVRVVAAAGAASAALISSRPACISCTSASAFHPI